MSPSLQKVFSIAKTILSDKAHPTTEQIREAVTSALKIYPAEQEHADTLITELEVRLNVWIGKGNQLEDSTDHVVWLPAKRANLEWKYWNRYKDLLELEKGFDDTTLDRLEERVDAILGRLEDPARPGAWDRRGLVVGHVQSGKTSSYTGLICKAADAGYRLIIVLAGVHDSLRSQTQLRLDEGFLGFDSFQLQNDALKGKPINPIGVGRIDRSVPTPDTITNRSPKGDFNKSVKSRFGVHPGEKPLLFVVKKQVSVLKNVLDYVNWVAQHLEQGTGRPIVTGIPILIVDDEADFASVDTKGKPIGEDGLPDKEHDPTQINKLIRKILYSFEKCAYVGYTATPFANTFIHEDAGTTECGSDLFPRSFIINLPAPSNYVGPVQVFGLDEDAESGQAAAEGLPIVRPMDDHLVWMPDGHKIDHIPGEPPESLRQSILAFVLSCAIRSVRGHEREHSSMLIHVTRFTSVQGHVAEQVSDLLKAIKRRLEHGEGNSPRKLSDQFRELWERDFAPSTLKINDPLCPPCDWDEVRARLHEAASRIVVRKINGSVKDLLDYADQKEHGLSVIAVGGDKLSRGLTLEGLSVSYYLRASRMYDTLMQMGRWFGYRPGYVDVCRLYTTAELIEWYEYITMASEELRRLFDQMADVGGTPRDFGVRVRSHSDLLITSQVKMKHGYEVNITYEGDVSETVAFHRDRATVERNFLVADEFIKKLGEPKRNQPQNKNALVWDNATADQVMRDFLGRIRVHERARKVRPELLREYIAKQVERGELTDWTVALISTPAGPGHLIGGHQLGLIKRSPHPDPPEADVYRIRRLLSPTDETIGLSKAQLDRALEETRRAWTPDPGRSQRNSPPDVAGPEYIRRVRDRTRGLLLIYPLVPEGVVDSEKPAIGFALSFPGSSNAPRVRYRVNNTYWRLEYADE